MVVAIHQPNYIPWAGYFYKMGESDAFVLLDSVQFPRGQSFANRNRIKTSQGTSWLTIPVSIPSGESGKIPYTEVQFANTKWKRKHLRTIQMNYKRSDHFNEIYPLLEKHISESTDFTDLNISLISEISRYLKIETRLIRLSDLLENFRTKTELIVDICNALGANVYLSGAGGGRSYNDEKLLQENGVELRYTQFNHPKYSQLWGAFEPDLSILDLLFNRGPESRKILFESQT